MKIFNKFLLFAGLLFLPLYTQSMGVSSGAETGGAAYRLLQRNMKNRQDAARRSASSLIKKSQKMRDLARRVKNVDLSNLELKLKLTKNVDERIRSFNKQYKCVQEEKEHWDSFYYTYISFIDVKPERAACKFALAEADHALKFIKEVMDACKNNKVIDAFEAKVDTTLKDNKNSFVDRKVVNEKHMRSTNSQETFSSCKPEVTVASDINKLDANGNTALFDPAQSGRIDAVIRLIKAGINVNIQGSYGCTALHRACIRDGNDKVVDVLLKAKADHTLKDNTNSTALHIAAMFGQTKAVGMLLQAKASVDEQDNNGSTALMEASRDGYVDVVGILLEKGKARLDIKIPQDTRIHTGRYTDFSKAYSNFTALDFAREFRHKHVVDKILLKSNGELGLNDEVRGKNSVSTLCRFCLVAQGQSAGGAAGGSCVCGKNKKN